MTKKILKYIYMIVTVIFTGINAYRLYDIKNYRDMILILIYALIITLVCLIKPYYSSLLGVCLSCFYFYGGVRETTVLFVISFAYWLLTLALAFVEAKDNRKLKEKTDTIHWIGVWLIVIYGFYNFAISMMIDMFVKENHLEAEEQMIVPLLILPISILVCYSTKRISGYIMSFLVCLRTWRCVRYVPYLGTKPNFYCKKHYDEDFSEFATKVVDDGLKEGMVVMGYIAILVLLRVVLASIKFVKEHNSKQMSNEEQG